jgi:hypothetical protein
MQSIRTWHTYIGILIAPSVLFFAFTGSLQLFSLHEAHDSYKPPPVIEKLASVHKDQVFALKEHDHEPEPSAGAQPGEHHEESKEEDAEPSLGTRLLKWFFLVVAVGLIASTSLGLWMGLTHLRHKRVGWWLLLTGSVIPVALSLF